MESIDIGFLSPVVSELLVQWLDTDDQIPSEGSEVVRQHDGLVTAPPWHPYYMATLVLWDVDHTLIENGGISKANYALAFEILTGRPATERAKTDGRTDVSIMAGILADNGEDPTRHTEADQLAALAEAGHRNRHDLARAGHALVGAREALDHFSSDPTIISSVLTGNIESNAKVKLAAFDLDHYVDFASGGFGAESAIRADLVPVAQGKAAERSGFDPTSDVTVLIGDTHRDVNAGLDGGARVIAVATGGETVEQLLDAGAHVALPDLSDLSLLIKALETVRQMGPAQLTSS